MTLAGGTAKGLQRVAMTAEELFHALRKGKLDINHAAVAENHDKEAQATAGRAHGDGTVIAPIDLGAFAGGKLQHQEGGLAHRAHQADKLLEDAVATTVPLSFELLEQLLGGVAMALQQRYDL